MPCLTNGRSGGILKGSSFEENGLHISKFVYLLDINSSEAFKKEGVTNDNFKVYGILYPLDSCLRNLLCADQASEEPTAKTKS